MLSSIICWNLNYICPEKYQQEIKPLKSIGMSVTKKLQSQGHLVESLSFLINLKIIPFLSQSSTQNFY